jgi:hypothetical protein
MPPSFDELSLRHLPDISDASFSFQIPSVSTGDLLLDDDDERDFFQNVDDTMGTPGPSRISRAPLTLSELTPKQEVQAPLQPQAGPSKPHDRRPHPKPQRNPQGVGRVVQARAALHKTTQKPTLEVKTQFDGLRGPEASPGAARLRTLRAEVELLGEDSRESTGASLDDISSSGPSRQESRDGSQPAGSMRDRTIAKPKRVRG